MKPLVLAPGKEYQHLTATITTARHHHRRRRLLHPSLPSLLRKTPRALHSVARRLTQHHLPSQKMRVDIQERTFALAGAAAGGGGGGGASRCQVLPCSCPLGPPTHITTPHPPTTLSRHIQGHSTHPTTPNVITPESHRYTNTRLLKVKSEIRVNRSYTTNRLLKKYPPLSKKKNLGVELYTVR